MEYAIELKGISKQFGTLFANKNVNLQLKKGEILALLGENGSGKTTLMNMLSGIYMPDSGSIFINGKKVSISSPEDSAKLGIGMVHQHFKLIERFSALDNIRIGLREDKSFLLKKDTKNEVMKMAEKFGFDIDPDKLVSNMSVSEKQTLEILKVLCYGAKIKEGHSIIIITHKLNEVMAISDRVTVLRHGEYINTVNTAETDEKMLTELMVGRKVNLFIERPPIEKTKPLLEIRGLTVKNDEGAVAVDHLDFYIRGGEILGVAGIAGSGQKELCEAIAGLRPIVEGKMIHKGENIVGLSPKKILEKGISMSFIPEDRLGMGLAPSLSITDNMILKNYSEPKGPFIDRKSAREEAKKVIERLKVVTPSTETPVRKLSGGNVQKVLLGREIKSGPNVLITAYPVRGLDINSSYMIYNILNDEKKKDVGILFIGEDIDVMMALCDKIMVICHGKLQGVVNSNHTTKEEIGLMMTGALNLVDKGGKTAGIARDSGFADNEETNETEEAGL